MRCIICAEISATSVSVEHVVPESLGNTCYILSKGLVCDDCNNYFARKIEGPLLEIPFFKQLRYKRSIVSKKGRIPPDKGFLIDPDFSEVIFEKDTTGELSILEVEMFNQLPFQELLNVFTVDFGLFDTQNEYISKFLAKAAIEGLAHDVLRLKGNLEEVINQPAFDPIKRYCRKARRNEFWPYSLRQVNLLLNHSNNSIIEYLNSLDFHFTFIYIAPGYFFFQFYLPGYELTIDMVNPTLANINTFFENNGGESRVLEHAINNFQAGL